MQAAAALFRPGRLLRGASRPLHLHDDLGDVKVNDEARGVDHGGHERGAGDGGVEAEARGEQGEDAAQNVGPQRDQLRGVEKAGKSGGWRT